MRNATRRLIRSFGFRVEAFASARKFLDFGCLAASGKEREQWSIHYRLSQRDQHEFLAALAQLPEVITIERPWSSEDNYVNHGVEVWQSTAPDGSVPWTLVTTYNSSNPMANGYSLGSFLGDLGGFVDPSTGLAYIIFNYGGNTETAYSRLDPSSYTNTLSTNTATYAQALEAHTVFYRNGEYFWISSLEMGDAWSLNEYATASAPI